MDRLAAGAGAAVAEDADDAPAFAPDANPRWVALADQPGQLVEGFYVKVASSGRFPSIEQCRASLQDAIRNEVQNYVGMRLGRTAEQRVEVPQELIDSTIRRGRIAEEHIESPTVAGGGKRLHALLVFDQRVQENLKALARDARVRDRVNFMGIIVGCALGSLAAVFGYLRIDTATKGYYSLRLRAALITVLFAAGLGIAWVAKYNPLW